MKRFFELCILLIVITPLFCGVYAEASVNTSTPGSSWVGTWTDANYSFSLSQDGLSITGIGTVSDPAVADPVRLSGIVSGDGKILKSVLISTGTLILNLSDDKMMFYGAGTVDTVDNTSKPFHYTFNAIRNGTTIIPDQEWTGIWASKRNLMNFSQEGASVSGDYHALPSLKFGGQVNGTISGDGKILTMTWISPENVTFTLYDDGKTMKEDECTEEKVSVKGYCLNLTKKA